MFAYPFPFVLCLPLWTRLLSAAIELFLGWNLFEGGLMARNFVNSSSSIAASSPFFSVCGLVYYLFFLSSSLELLRESNDDSFLLTTATTGKFYSLFFEAVSLVLVFLPLTCFCFGSFVFCPCYLDFTSTTVSFIRVALTGEAAGELYDDELLSLFFKGVTTPALS